MSHQADLPFLQRQAYRLSRKPSVGDTMWWRGMRMEIFEVKTKRMIFKYKNEQYQCASSLLEVKRNAEQDFWFLPGVEGEMPKKVRGEIIDPAQPRCIRCKKTTFRKRLCTDCRLAEQEAK